MEDWHNRTTSLLSSGHFTCHYPAISLCAGLWFTTLSWRLKHTLITVIILFTHRVAQPDDQFIISRILHVPLPRNQFVRWLMVYNIKLALETYADYEWHNQMTSLLSAGYFTCHYPAISLCAGLWFTTLSWRLKYMLITVIILFTHRVAQPDDKFVIIRILHVPLPRNQFVRWLMVYNIKLALEIYADYDDQFIISRILHVPLPRNQFVRWLMVYNIKLALETYADYAGYYVSLPRNQFVRWLMVYNIKLALETYADYGHHIFVIIRTLHVPLPCNQFVRWLMVYNIKLALETYADYDDQFIISRILHVPLPRNQFVRWLMVYNIKLALETYADYEWHNQMTSLLSAGYFTCHYPAISLCAGLWFTTLSWRLKYMLITVIILFTHRVAQPDDQFIISRILHVPLPRNQFVRWLMVYNIKLALEIYADYGHHI
ncbi:hypothetical protein J6590_067590 [Homalodisca vitripennis]|nr:hypothetical protein J6590_067590 [Homalodisca vitripennis]